MRRLFFDHWGNEIFPSIYSKGPFRIVESYVYTLADGEMVDIAIVSTDGTMPLPYVIEMICNRLL